MKRRVFLKNILIGSSAVLTAGIALAKAIIPRRFVRAKPLSKYPGRLKSFDNIKSQAKWRG